MTVSGNQYVNLTVKQVGAAFGGGPDWDVALKFSENIVNGNGAGQADLIYAAERTLAASGNDDIDLAGILMDVLNQTITFNKLAGLLLMNKPQDTSAVNTTTLTIGGGTNPFLGFLGGTTPTLGPIQPGGVLLLTNMASDAGLGTVVNSSADILRIANGGAAENKYQIAIWGRTAP